MLLSKTKKNTLTRRLFEDAGRVSFVDLQDHGRAKIRFESPYDADQGTFFANEVLVIMIFIADKISEPCEKLEKAVSRFHNYMIEGHALQVRVDHDT